MSSSDVIEIQDEPLALYKGDFSGTLIYEILVGCLLGLLRSRRAKNWHFKAKKAKIAVLGNPDPRPDKNCTYLNPDPPSG